MDNERSSGISIGGQEYEMLLTTKATKEIAKRYGGLSNLGEKLMKTENFEMALDEVVWLITLLANQWCWFTTCRILQKSGSCLLRISLSF